MGKKRAKSHCRGSSIVITKDIFTSKRKKGEKYRHAKIAVRILRTIGNLWLECKSGVYYEGLGYFYVNRTPFMESIPTRRRPKFNKLGHRMSFIADKKGPLANYVIDFSGGVRSRARLSKKVQSGHRYLNLMTSVLDYDSILIGVRKGNIKGYKDWVKENGL